MNVTQVGKSKKSWATFFCENSKEFVFLEKAKNVGPVKLVRVIERPLECIKRFQTQRETSSMRLDETLETKTLAGISWKKKKEAKDDELDENNWREKISFLMRVSVRA